MAYDPKFSYRSHTTQLSLYETLISQTAGTSPGGFFMLIGDTMNDAHKQVQEAIHATVERAKAWAREDKIRARAPIPKLTGAAARLQNDILVALKALTALSEWHLEMDVDTY